ncbi:hypothetical protein KL86DPRO_40044 [uncultured delta proteobacterium]|uniref:Uncharacterized protein n=1 Tax=uncultured delta proteobacterium TaxID=34034 RepID=A0A212K9D0_9DELT|nr:hypothetical protein KL86DPRO_40044 [uncultured delta proteobacterium]
MRQGIQRTHRQNTIQRCLPDEGGEVWRLSEGLGSGWKFEIELTFDAKGLVSKFTFACRDAA